jgi:hypothetical protein
MAKQMSGEYDCGKCSGHYTVGNMSPVCPFCYDNLKKRMDSYEAILAGILKRQDEFSSNQIARDNIRSMG